MLQSSRDLDFSLLLYSRFFLVSVLILSHRNTMTMEATIRSITKVTVTPMKAAVLRQRLSGTEFRLITTSSLSSSASLNWTSEGETTWGDTCY